MSNQDFSPLNQNEPGTNHTKSALKSKFKDKQGDENFGFERKPRLKLFSAQKSSVRRLLVLIVAPSLLYLLAGVTLDF